jgi:hypothetical protein
MVNFNPPVEHDVPQLPLSPTLPKSPTIPVSPSIPRRTSSTGDQTRSASRPPIEGSRRRRESSGRIPTLAGLGVGNIAERLIRGEATIRGVSIFRFSLAPD